MNSFTVLVLCIQACLVQNVFSQCYGSYGAEVINKAGLGIGGTIAPPPIYIGTNYAGAVPAVLGYANNVGAPAFLANAGAPNAAAYGGAGEGTVAVTGDLPVAGNTVINGQVPVLGAVSFAGNVPAAGSVSIRGNCACGCASY